MNDLVVGPARVAGCAGGAWFLAEHRLPVQPVEQGRGLAERAGGPARGRGYRVAAEARQARERWDGTLAFGVLIPFIPRHPLHPRLNLAWVGRHAGSGRTPMPILDPLTRQIIGLCYRISTILGHGFE